LTATIALNVRISEETERKIEAIMALTYRGKGATIDFAVSQCFAALEEAAQATTSVEEALQGAVPNHVS